MMDAMACRALIVLLLVHACLHAGVLPRGAVRKFVVTEDGEGVLWSVAFAPDGKTLAVGGSLKRLHLWDVRSGELLRSFGSHPDNVWAVAFSPDGKLLCSGGRADLTLRAWNPAKGDELTPFEGHRGGITSIRFFRDGKRLIMAGGSWDPTIRVWDVAARKQTLALTGHGDLIDAMDLASHGRLAVSAGRDGSVRLWNLVAGREIWSDHRTEGEGYVSTAFSPDARLFAAGTYEGQLEVRETLSRKRCLPLIERRGAVKAVAFSPHGRTFAFAGGNSLVEIADSRTGEVLDTFKGHQGTIRALAFSPDGNSLASVGDDATAFIWQVSKPKVDRRPLTGDERREAWERLASENAVIARVAMVALAEDSGPAVAYLAERLRPASAVDEKPLIRAVEQLNSPRFAEREKAYQELERAGESAGPLLQRILESASSAEVRGRIRRLLERWDRSEPDGATRQAIRALAVLERQNDEAARLLVRRLADGAADARLTIEARETLERMKK